MFEAPELSYFVHAIREIVLLLDRDVQQAICLKFDIFRQQIYLAHPEICTLSKSELCLIA